MSDEVGIIKKGELLYQGTIESLRGKNNSKILVGVSNRPGALELLRKRGYRVKEEKDKLCVNVEGLSASKLCKELVLSGVEVNYLSEDKKSLEDIFLSLTMEGEVC